MDPMGYKDPVFKKNRIFTAKNLMILSKAFPPESRLLEAPVFKSLEKLQRWATSHTKMGTGLTGWFRK